MRRTGRLVTPPDPRYPPLTESQPASD
jgi:hypothetical protein